MICTRTNLNKEELICTRTNLNKEELICTSKRKDFFYLFIYLFERGVYEN